MPIEPVVTELSREICGAVFRRAFAAAFLLCSTMICRWRLQVCSPRFDVLKLSPEQGVEKVPSQESLLYVTVLKYRVILRARDLRGR